MTRDAALRTVGWVCLCGLAATILAFISVLSFGVPSHPWTLRWLVGLAMLFLFVPSLLTEWDLDTGKLAEPSKREWGHQLVWGAWGLVASYFYLLRKDRRIGKAAE